MKVVQAKGATNVEKVIRFFGFLRVQSKSKTGYREKESRENNLF
jgi:hypothetical protein